MASIATKTEKPSLIPSSLSVITLVTISGMFKDGVYSWILPESEITKSDLFNNHINIE